MKPLLHFSLLAIVTFVFTACQTPATRRDLFAPQTVEGPYTKQLKGR